MKLDTDILLRLSQGCEISPMGSARGESRQRIATLQDDTRLVLPGSALGILALLLFLSSSPALAQRSADPPARLSRDRLKSGAQTLQAFAPVSASTRHSVVKLDLDGETVALATVVSSNGLALTKASEIGAGPLTGWLAGGSRVGVERLAVDEENDVALVKVAASGLKPVRWSLAPIAVGQWAVTPGIEETPHAVGIISVTAPRKIQHKRALIGVELDLNSSLPRIAKVMPGMSAEKAGIKPGDVVLAVNETAVSTRRELTSTLRNFREGQAVSLRFKREEETMTATLEMEVPEPGRGSGSSREDRMDRMGGELSRRAEGFSLAIQHDTVLQPWQCGGPLVNLDGQAIGLNIARSGRVASYALPASLARQIAERLQTQARRKAKDSKSIHTSQNTDTSSE
jgi:serine protease Do